jgi:hypothetical protein
LGGGIGKFFDGGVSKSGAAAAGAFTPTSLFSSNTGGWWDPSDHTTTFQDTAGTTPANTAGQAVARINDKSGNGNNLLQATGTAQPILQNTGAFWWLQFDGAAQYISAAFTLGQPLTRISCARNITWTATHRMWDGNTVNGAGLIQGQSVVTPGIQMFAGSIAPTDASNFTVGADHVVSEFFSGAASTLTVDNNTANTGNSGTATADGAIIGAAGNISLFGNIRWYGAVHIGRALTGAETANSRMFFGAKAGL